MRLIECDGEDVLRVYKGGLCGDPDDRSKPIATGSNCYKIMPPSPHQHSPGYNAGYQPPPLHREPSLSRPVGHGVDRDEGEAVTEADGEDNQPERGVESPVGGGVAGTE